MKRRYVNIYLILSLAVLLTAVSCSTPAGRAPGQVWDDGAITSSIKTKLLADRTLSGLAISVETFQGNVTLTGAVDNNDQKQKAGEIAKETKSVQKVNNLLMMKKS
jgi:hyperosmotically inducible periplasmic protein